MFKTLALALIVATASAAKARQDGPPADMSCHDVAMAIGEKCDANGNEKISWKEAKACGAPREFKPEFDRVAGADGQVDYDEFMAECNKQ